ncbi:GTPase IMAP family member 4-like [Corticium candelabrum]|uniref:GTPase IMAP family member 4-like n=1 Tax=Corticium candelabrum TaxID=121492 RepID=UPI002E26A95C|nr:GTPase IMAP family member 4-like [Corticium candelabrum]
MSVSEAASNNRTVVLVGRTGVGKSACANTLAGADLFEESNLSASQTKFVNSQTIRVVRSGKEYNVKIVDTVGIGDTELSPDEVLQRLATACNECVEGINSVFFVTKDRFTKEEADAWDVMWQVLFGAEVLEFSSIIRTNFLRFRDQAAVAKDKEQLKLTNKDAQRVLTSVRYFLHVDNPPSEYGGEIIREHSREILLKHLIVNCEEVFQPPVLREVKERISGHVQAHQEARDKIQQLEAQLEETSSEKERLKLRAELAEANKTERDESKVIARVMERILEKDREREERERERAERQQMFEIVGETLKVLGNCLVM